MHLVMNFIIIILINLYSSAIKSEIIMELTHKKTYQLKQSSAVYDLLINNKLIVPIFNQNELLFFDSEGNLINSIKKIHTPHALVENNDYIFVASYKKNILYKISSKTQSKIIKTYELQKNSNITSLEIFDNVIFLSDYKSGKVLKFNTDKEIFKEIANFPGSRIHDINFLNNKLYLLDRKSKKIILLDDKFELIKEINLKKKSENFDPLSFIIYNNLLIVTDYFDSSLNIFTNTGKHLSLLKFSEKGKKNFPTSIFIDEKSKILYLSFQNLDKVISYYFKLIKN